MVSPSLYQEQKHVEETYPYNITAADQAVGIPVNNVVKKAVEDEAIARGVTGVVKSFNVKNGYGFINRDDNRKELLRHSSRASCYSRRSTKLSQLPVWEDVPCPY